MREMRVVWDGDSDGVGWEMRADERTELEMMKESMVRQNKRMKKIYILLVLF